MVFVFGYLWANCEAILPFLWLQWGAPNNGGKYTFKLFSFPNVEKARSLLVKCWITIVAMWKYVGEIWERIKEFQSDLKTLANLRTNVVMAEAVLPGYAKIYFAFLIHVAN